MIQKIITGREESLAKTTKDLLGKVERHEYINAAKIFPKEEVNIMQERAAKARKPEIKGANYTSPFAPIGKTSGEKTNFVADSMPHGEKIDFNA